MAKIAVIAEGGKQYLVKEGDVVSVEKIADTKGVGSKISFDTVLLTDDGSTVKLGSPSISGAKVTGEVVAEGRDPKVTVIHYRAKSRYFKKRGHRQHFTKVKITSL